MSDQLSIGSLNWPHPPPIPQLAPHGIPDEKRYPTSAMISAAFAASISA